MKSTVFWDITPCSPLKVNKRFGGRYLLYVQDRSINKQSSSCHQFLRLFHAQTIFWTWRWIRYVPPNLRLTFNGLHGVMSQKIVLFSFGIDVWENLSTWNALRGSRRLTARRLFPCVSQLTDNWLHGDVQFCSYSTISQYFMEVEGSLPCSQ
jgi:hypothetical protein